MTAPDVTTLLHAWREGDTNARDELIPLVYQELRRRAAAYLSQAHLPGKGSTRS